MKLEPLNDRVLIRPLEAAGKTASGLLTIPDGAKEKQSEGEILAVGPGRIHEATGARTPIELKVGDMVLYAKFSGIELKQDGEDVLLLEEGDVLAIVRK